LHAFPDERHCVAANEDAEDDFDTVVAERRDAGAKDGRTT